MADARPTSEEYLRNLLGFASNKELVEFLNQPDHPSVGMKRPDMWYREVNELAEHQNRQQEGQQPTTPSKK